MFPLNLLTLFVRKEFDDNGYSSVFTSGFNKVVSTSVLKRATNKPMRIKEFNFDGDCSMDTSVLERDMQNKVHQNHSSFIKTLIKNCIGVYLTENLNARLFLFRPLTLITIIIKQKNIPLKI